MTERAIKPSYATVLLMYYKESNEEGAPRNIKLFLLKMKIQGQAPPVFL